MAIFKWNSFLFSFLRLNLVFETIFNHLFYKSQLIIHGRFRPNSGKFRSFTFLLWVPLSLLISFNKIHGLFQSNPGIIFVIFRQILNPKLLQFVRGCDAKRNKRGKFVYAFLSFLWHLLVFQLIYGWGYLAARKHFLMILFTTYNIFIVFFVSLLSWGEMDDIF